LDTRRLLSFILTALLWSLPLFSQQSVHPLTGRQIAPVMGADGADWLERPERESEEAPEKALDAISPLKGMVVGDVGAGTGYFSIRLARRVGATGKVYANDLQPKMLTLLRANAAKAGVSNIETVLGSEADPKLPVNALDLVLLVDVYHEFSQPQQMLQHIRASLKPDGRLVLLEYRKEDPSVPIRPEHKMSVKEVRTEVEAEGYKFDRVIETLPRQHIIIFKKGSM
jgi:ubiquinone/menaquinone biosynthesis C-methylase UbiE